MMEGVFENARRLLNHPEDYLRASRTLQDAWVQQTKEIYDLMKNEEEIYDLTVSSEILKELCTNGLHSEQIWQQVELQNRYLLAASEDFSNVDELSLCYAVAKLSSLAKLNRLGIEANGKVSFVEENTQNHEEDVDYDSGQEYEDVDLGDKKLSNKHEIDNAFDVFDDESDDEKDEFDLHDAEEEEEEGREFEDEDQESGSTDSEKDEHDAKSKKRKDLIKFDKTQVDTQFFRLRESEWVADNDMIGDNFNYEKEDELDYMEDAGDSSDNEDGATAMYSAFFDTPEEGIKNTKKINTKKDTHNNDGSNHDEDEGETSDEEDSAESEDNSPLFGSNKEKGQSTFEKKRKLELKAMEELEEGNVEEKPWFLQGEVEKKNRPENSALEDLECDVAVRNRPVVTEDTTVSVEKLILKRIRSNAWDDVERKIKPNVDPYEFKKKLLLEQEKSKQSLAEIYEKEYLEKQKQAKEGMGEQEELKEHQEINSMMLDLFSKFDALANNHYTPSLKNTEVKIVSNMPTITMEEATPTLVSNATLLAPEEVLEPGKGELQGATERTSEDRKRDRRKKKSRQKNYAKAQDAKLQEMKKVGPGGKINKRMSIKAVEKAVKTGGVKVLESTEGQSLTSSKAFFSQLQDCVTEARQKAVQGAKRQK
ncbi:U3 small nucleolar ribonucleoprotein MPP10 [Oratosquilla oratoria]|uniref:U3 small nucleolar ribonucleoprotein MPP10 n=1 Tax=Oratosquilla oratoria TaxID=337810 RepID=UPI003F76DCEB